MKTLFAAMVGVMALFVVDLDLGWAQGGYTIQTPGQMPTYVTPNYGGGYTIQTPGQMPTYVNPR
jgi:hypothetical protein